MNSDFKKWLNTTGPVIVDTTLTKTGVRWNNTVPIDNVVQKLNTTFVVPATAIVFSATSFSRLQGQYNYSLGQSFSILNWLNLQDILSNHISRGGLVISYRVGNRKIRYLLANNTNDGGLNVGNLPLYTGQKIDGNFTIEVYSIVNVFGNKTVGFNAITFITSILNDPSLPSDNIGPSISSILFSGQRNAMSWAMPQTFNANGPFLTN